MVDQQEFHHAFARLAHHWRLGENFGRFALRTGPAVAHAPRARGYRLGRALELDQAHTAVAGNREALMEAEVRDLRARGLARLQQRVVRRNIDLFAVDDELGHVNATSATATIQRRWRCRRPCPTAPTMWRYAKTDRIESSSSLRPST